MLDDRHRAWVAALGLLRTRDGVEFDPTKIVPYAYRHSLRYLPWLGPGEGRGLRGRSGTCLTSIRNSFVPAATFAT